MVINFNQQCFYFLQNNHYVKSKATWWCNEEAEETDKEVHFNFARVRLKSTAWSFNDMQTLYAALLFVQQKHCNIFLWIVLRLQKLEIVRHFCVNGIFQKRIFYYFTSICFKCDGMLLSVTCQNVYNFKIWEKESQLLQKTSMAIRHLKTMVEQWCKSSLNSNLVLY